MSATRVGSLWTGNVPAAICHLYRECPLLRRDHDLIGGPSRVHQKLTVLFHQSSLKVFVLIRLPCAGCFFLVVVPLTIPHEYLSIADHCSARAHTMAPACSCGAERMFFTGDAVEREKYSRTSHSAACGTASLTAFDKPWEISSGKGPVWQASTRTSTPQLSCNSRSMLDVGN